MYEIFHNKLSYQHHVHWRINLTGLAITFFMFHPRFTHQPYWMPYFNSLPSMNPLSGLCLCRYSLCSKCSSYCINLKDDFIINIVATEKNSESWFDVQDPNCVELSRFFVLNKPLFCTFFKWNIDVKDVRTWGIYR